MNELKIMSSKLSSHLQFRILTELENQMDYYSSELRKESIQDNVMLLTEYRAKKQECEIEYNTLYAIWSTIN